MSPGSRVVGVILEPHDGVALLLPDTARDTGSDAHAGAFVGAIMGAIAGEVTADDASPVGAMIRLAKARTGLVLARWELVAVDETAPAPGARLYVFRLRAPRRVVSAIARAVPRARTVPWYDRGAFANAPLWRFVALAMVADEDAELRIVRRQQCEARAHADSPRCARAVEHAL